MFVAALRGFREGDAEGLAVIANEAFRDEAVRLAGEAGAGKLWLGTRSWNGAMRAVCLSLGFVEEAVLRRECLGEDLVRCAYFYE